MIPDSEPTGGIQAPLRNQEVILVVEDDRPTRDLLEYEITSLGYTCRAAGTGEEARAILRSEGISLVLQDLGLPDVGGMQLLEEIRAGWPETLVIMVTAEEDLSVAVDCMRRGAADYLNKPVDAPRLAATIAIALERATMKAQLAAVARERRDGNGLSTFLGRAPSIVTLKDLVMRAVPSDVTILLQGESGTGKDVLARAIHAESARAAGPFQAINCGAIPETLVESELFGHQKGSFTGATKDRAGLFEQANGGTVFLDEVGELRLDLQVRLLRVLQDRSIKRLGSDRERSVDVRIIAATNKELQPAVADGSFREDLYYRLAVFPVALPPLRGRAEDIPLLASHFIDKYASRMAPQVVGLSDRAKEAISQYRWPGNVRELENTIERALLLAKSDHIDLDDLPDEVVCALLEDGLENFGTAAPEAQGRHATVEDILSLEEEERRIFTRALELTQWNVTAASEKLGIGRATLYRKINSYGLTRLHANGEATS